jgi:tagatose 6-phosphate kinase
LPWEPDIVKINVPEFVQTFFAGRLALEQEVDTEETARITENLITLTKQSATIIALSHGRHDSLLAVAGAVEAVPVHSVTVKNTIGCGDSAMAGFAAGRARGDVPRAALLLGHTCAAQNAGVYKPGSLHEGPPADESMLDELNRAEE